MVIINSAVICSINNMFHRITMHNFNMKSANQSNEVIKAVKAMHDLCDAVKNMDTEHQQQATALCLAEIAREFGWQS